MHLSNRTTYVSSVMLGGQSFLAQGWGPGGGGVGHGVKGQGEGAKRLGRGCGVWASRAGGGCQPPSGQPFVMFSNRFDSHTKISLQKELNLGPWGMLRSNCMQLAVEMFPLLGVSTATFQYQTSSVISNVKHHTFVRW